VLGYAGDVALTDAAVAEAFAQLLRRGDAVSDQRAHVWRAAFRIAAGELQRRGRTTQDVIERAVEDPEPDWQLLGALQSLSEQQRAIVILRDYADHSGRVTAERSSDRPNSRCACSCRALVERCEGSWLVSGSVEDLLMTLDRIDAPDQWSDIVARGDATSSNASGRRLELVLEATPRAVHDENPRKRGVMNRRGMMSALGVAAAAAALVLAVVVVDRDDDGSDGPSPATDPPAAAETLPRPFDEQAALSANAAYFDAYNAGDLEAVMAMFVADATFAGSLGPMHRPEFDELIAWNLAQGTVLTTPECDVTELEIDAVFSVVCSYGTSIRS